MGQELARYKVFRLTMEFSKLFSHDILCRRSMSFTQRKETKRKEREYAIKAVLAGEGGSKKRL